MRRLSSDGPCLVCELLGQGDHRGMPDGSGGDIGESPPIGQCHQGMVMRLAEQFNQLPFMTIVEAVQATVANWDRRSPSPSAEELERESARLLQLVRANRAVRR